MRRNGFQMIAIELLCATLLAGSGFSGSLTSFLHRAPAADTSAMDEVQADDELNEFMGLVRHDLTVNRTRERERLAVLNPAPQNQQRPVAQNTLINITNPTSNVSITNDFRSVSLIMPVSGVTREDLQDSWGDPRDGGRRRHRGIDIFAPRGTQVIAVTNGYISYIGDQPKGGHCMWLVSEEGMSFYYAHLDRWAPGLYEGMEVHAGDVLGYVGNTGNAAHTPSHLHFSVMDNDEAVNPYKILKYGRSGGPVTLRGSIVAGGAR
jgi:murein DD-endopeptidase MepM/ murein hydrolase activator NlpD